jgi:methyl-accepting chemotaxis protein
MISFRKQPLRIQIIGVLVTLAALLLLEFMILYWQLNAVFVTEKEFNNYTSTHQSIVENLNVFQVKKSAEEWSAVEQQIEKRLSNSGDQLKTKWELLKEKAETYISTPETLEQKELVMDTSGVQNEIIHTIPNPEVEKVKQRVTAESEEFLALLNEELSAMEKSVANAGRVSVLLIVTFLLIDVAFFIFLIRYFNKNVLVPLRLIRDNTLAHTHTFGLAANEVGDVSIAVNEVIENLKDATDFVTTIGEGKLDFDYKILDPGYEPGKNKLADSLLNMQQKLRELNAEDEKRQWANEGLAKFVEILRSTTNQDLNLLGDSIISTLVKYTQSVQGGLYVLNDDDAQNPHLELISLYAYDRKKHRTRQIYPGQGLVGEAFLEKETTYLKEVPDDYVNITSGLGVANPRTLLIVPLKIDRDIYGVVELASFKEFAPHVIAFVEKLGETIASTLATVKNSQRTRRLLEESSIAAEAMKAQEEEMRQNMEELTATQEEMQRIVKEAQQKETYLSNLMDATTDAFVAIDRDYKVIIRNNAPLFDHFVKQGIPYEKGYYVLSAYKADEIEHHKSIYDRAFAGESFSVMKEYFGHQYEVNYRPLRAGNGQIIGAAIYAHDYTEKIELELIIEGYKKQLEAARTQAAAPAEPHWADMEKALQIHIEALEIARQSVTPAKP